MEHAHNSHRIKNRFRKSLISILQRITPKSRQLKKDAPDKERIVFEVAFPKTARFLDQAIKPLEAAALNPTRRLFDLPADQVEGSAPIPSMTVVSKDSIVDAINRSCLGVLNPTQKKSGRLAETCA